MGDEELEAWIDEAGEALQTIAAERDIMAAVYLCDSLPVRTGPSCDSEAAVTVLSGQQVNLLDVYVDEDGQVWEYVWLEDSGVKYYGYLPRQYLACADSRFLEWEEEYGMNPSASTYAVSADGSYADIAQFPESYQTALKALKESHPNWTFVKMNTNLDWDTVIYNEMQGGKSLVYKTMPDWTKGELYDSGSWYYATTAAVAMYMDPRNFLTEDGIFQFEQLTYNEEYHTKEAIDALLKDTFMSSTANAPETSMTFADIFYAVGVEKTVSPFHLAARVLQEQGTKGGSALISGTYPGYEGYYNYFNIGASGKTTEEVVLSGLQYAKNHWSTGAYYSIYGGAEIISANYIRKGQHTLYLQKFNVNPAASNALYTHQYMQNISAPKSEAASIKKLYASAGALESPFVFIIPVFENMPAEPCGEPKPDTNVTVTLPTGYSGTELWLDGVAYTGTLKNGQLTVTAPDANAATAVMYQYNENNVPTGMYVWFLSYTGMTYTATAEPELTDLLTYHGFSIRITGKSGIRFKTGISVELRKKLLSSEGVNGYRLKEYGTLVMYNQNRGQYPMVKGGQKVSSGISYGLQSSGSLRDVVFEKVDDRYRFTSVFTGIPVEYYKTEYAFRGYIILEKGGVDYTLYGPVQAKSIYGLAEQLLAAGIYAEGTETNTFLKKIITDADEAEAAAQSLQTTER